MSLKVIIGIIVLIVLCIVSFFTFTESYVVHEGNVVYIDKQVPTKKICSGLTVVLQNPKEHHADGFVSGYCVGEVIDRPQLTENQARKVEGSRLFYLKFDTKNSNGTLSMSELVKLQSDIDYRNTNQYFPGFREDHIPVVVGSYKGLDVVEKYWCSDACPDNGIIFLNYASSTEESCEELGGYKLYKWGWGYQYIGCSPTKNSFSD